MNNKAYWEIGLYTKCPKCGESFDILDHDDDLFTNGIEPIEHGTPASTGYDVECPECDHEFKVDFQY